MLILEHITLIVLKKFNSYSKYALKSDKGVYVSKIYDLLIKEGKETVLAKK